MEQEGIVPIWAGVFETKEDLMKYTCEMDALFFQDFFGGEEWPFDTDFWERNIVPVTTDPETLVEQFSEGTAIGPALKRFFSI